ncbi:hypothetical protein ABZ636_31385 [Streptomyces sp. NPDC007251]|uniref:hypothetical protein n=1 Tax=Streptomyces sp. NPDC007251 TaxID=3154483 RepID=UPI0033E1C032
MADFPYKDYARELPIAEYTLNETQVEVVSAAEHTLIAACVKRFGIQDDTATFEATRVPDRRYGLQDARSAHEYGYHLPPDHSKPAPKSISTVEKNVLYGTAMMKAMGLPYRSEINGLKVPPGGCKGETDKNFEARYTYKEGAAAAREIATESFTQSLKSAELSKQFADWSSCMREAGYRYGTPLEPLADASFTGRKISKRERETADRDLLCKGRTDLLKKWFTIESRIQRRLIEVQKFKLDRLKLAQRRRVEKAEEIVEHARR